MTLKARDGHVCGGGNQPKISSPGIALISRTLVGSGKGAACTMYIRIKMCTI